MNNFLKQVWIAFKIWLIAVSIDTLIGSLFVTAGFSADGETALRFIEIYATLSAMFSFPIFLTLIFIINRCHARNVTGHRTFLIMLLSGIGLTILMFAIFLSMIGNMDKMYFGHLLIALLSAFAAVCIQYVSIQRTVEAG